MTVGRSGRLAMAATALAATVVGCTSSVAGRAIAVAGGPCAPYAQYGHFDNASVTMLQERSVVNEQTFVDSFARFVDCTGITVHLHEDTNTIGMIEEGFLTGVEPDVATVAQPGLFRRWAPSGAMVEAPPAVRANLRKFWALPWQNYVTVDGKVYGAPLGTNVKSLVWYSPKQFRENGWKIPQTLGELKTLSDTIADTGVKPWCVGIENSAGTGWPVTDWMEDMMLRLSGPDTYDKWVAHRIPFNGPQSTAALNAVGEYIRNDKYVNGGHGDVASIASTSVADAGLPIRYGECALSRQASFYANVWGPGTTIGENGDVDAFYFPAKDTISKPVLGGGEFLAAFSDRPPVQAFQAFLSSDTWADAMVAAAAPNGGWISANTGMDASKLTNATDRLCVAILRDPKSVFRFDGSDQMPPAIGLEAFFQESTNWILGQSTKVTLDAIEKAWPKH